MEDMKSLSILSILAKGCDDPDAISLPDVFLYLMVLQLSQQYETLGEATLISAQTADPVSPSLRGEAVVSTQPEVG